MMLEMTGDFTKGDSIVVVQKHSQMLVHQESPLNAGFPTDLLRESFITPQEQLFVRNHGNIPTIDLQAYRLEITGMVQRSLKLSLADIQQFPVHTVMAALQCAGSRRKELHAVNHIPGELLWGAEPIGNVIWCGARLCDVLELVGVQPQAQHVALTGLDDVERQGKHINFGGSIPIHKAVHPDVLLAYEMNGEPLTPVHGAPLRIVAPGFIGARSVKWLGSIVVQEKPSTNYFQTHAYKLFPQEVNAQNVDWSSGLMLAELPLQAVICRPQEGEVYQEGEISIQGWALTGKGSPIECVEVSTDGGASWITAYLRQQESPWPWCFWEVKIPMCAGMQCIIARAWDAYGEQQPAEAKHIWNFKGYLNNSWHKVTVRIQTR
jgi:sulfite oxidase